MGLIAAEEVLAILKADWHMSTQCLHYLHKLWLSLVTRVAAPVFGLWSVARVYFPGWELATFCWCLACAALPFFHVIVKQEIPISSLSFCVEQSPGEQTPRSCSTVVSAHTHHSPNWIQSVCVFLFQVSHRAISLPLIRLAGNSPPPASESHAGVLPGLPY